MTGEERTRLRLAVSKARADLIQIERDLHPRMYCKSCGTHLRNYTDGCRACSCRKTKNRPKSDTCKGCGADLHNRTRGCRVCMTRHWKRQARNSNQPAQPPAPGTCKGCGEPYYEQTPGCVRCTERTWARVDRVRKRAA